MDILGISSVLTIYKFYRSYLTSLVKVYRPKTTLRYKDTILLNICVFFVKFYLYCLSISKITQAEKK